MDVVVRRYIDFLLILLFPTPLVLALFLTAASLLLCSFLKCFFVLVYVVFVQYSKRCSKNIRDCSKIEITWTWRYDYIDTNVCCLRVPRLPRARYRVTFHGSCGLTLCMIIAS